MPKALGRAPAGMALSLFRSGSLGFSWCVRAHL